MLKVCINCWLSALLKIRLFFTCLNNIMVSRFDILQLTTALSRTHIKGCFLKKYWTGNSIGCMRVIMQEMQWEACQTTVSYSLYTFSYKWPNISQMGLGWMQRISCTSEMEGPVNTVAKPHNCYFPHSIFVLENNFKSEQSNLQLVIIMNISDK